MFELDLEKAEEPEIKLSTSAGSSKKQENSRTDTSVLLNMLKPLTVWITTNWKILQETGIPDHLTCLLRNLYAGQEATESDMEQQTGSKLGKEYVKTVYCHPHYLTYMQSTSCEMLGWMKHKLESRFPGKISITSDIRWYHPYGRKQRGTKESLDEGERGEWKLAENSTFKKLRSWATGPITSWQIDGETMETMTNFIFLDSKITADGDCSHEIKRRLLGPWKKSYDKPRWHIKKQRHYIANKGPYNQSYGFSGSHVWVWELDH